MLRHAEVAEADGSIYTAKPAQRVADGSLRVQGRRRGGVRARFTCHGFRFVEVTGLPGKPAATDLEGCVVGNAAVDAGTFHASDPMLDHLWSNIRWTLRGNLLTVPNRLSATRRAPGLDGRHRAFAQTAVFLRDVSGAFAKWIQDVRDAQADDGRYPDFAPHPYGRTSVHRDSRMGRRRVIVPWVAWLNYGDKRLVQAHLRLDAEVAREGPFEDQDLVWRKRARERLRRLLNGDTLVHEGWPKTGASTPGEVLATAYFAHSAKLVARMASAVGRTEDAKRCQTLFEGIRSAFQKAFLAEDGRVQGDSQGAYALALASTFSRGATIARDRPPRAEHREGLRRTPVRPVSRARSQR